MQCNAVFKDERIASLSRASDVIALTAWTPTGERLWTEGRR